MASTQGNKASEKISRQNYAHRYAHIRAVRFETKGFKSNAPTPSLAEAQAMAAYNRRLIDSMRPAPSITQ